MGAIQASEAVDELIAMRSSALGHAAATNGDNSRVKLAQRSLIERAYPEIVEVPKEVDDGPPV